MVDATKPSRLLARAHPPPSCTIPQAGLTACNKTTADDHRHPIKEHPPCPGRHHTVSSCDGWLRCASGSHHLTPQC